MKKVKKIKRRYNKNLKRCTCGRFMGWKEEPITCQQCGKSLCSGCVFDYADIDISLGSINIDYSYKVCGDCDKKLEDLCDTYISSVDEDGDEYEDDEKADKICKDFQKAFDEQFKNQMDDFIGKRLLGMAIVSKT